MSAALRDWTCASSLLEDRCWLDARWLTSSILARCSACIICTFLAVAELAEDLVMVSVVSSLEELIEADLALACSVEDDIASCFIMALLA